MLASQIYFYLEDFNTTDLLFIFYYFNLCEHSKTKKSGSYEATGVNDQDSFASMRAAFDGIGLVAKQRQNIFRALVGILILGNVTFEDRINEAGNTAARVSNMNILEKVSELWELPSQALCDLLLAHQLSTPSSQPGKRSSTYTIAHDAEQSKNGRDAIAKVLFSLLLFASLFSVSFIYILSFFKHI